MDIGTDKIVQVIFLSREGARASTELRNFIEEMNEDEQATLVAVAWVGRDTFDAEDYEDALRTAREEATTPTADYLMGMPHLAENLEYGMDRLGIDVTAEEDDFG
jgi:hypothetical protein